MSKRRNFTCAACGKQNTFDADKARRKANFMERAGCETQFLAYLPQCRHCGQENEIPISSNRKNGAANRTSAAPLRRNRSARRQSQGSSPAEKRAELEALAQRNGVKPIKDPDTMIGNFWPAEETVDEFLAAVRALRQQGK